MTYNKQKIYVQPWLPFGALVEKKSCLGWPYIYIYIYTQSCIYINIYTHIYIYSPVYIYTVCIYIYIYSPVYIYIQSCIYIYIQSCIYIYIESGLYINIYIHIYIYIYTVLYINFMLRYRILGQNKSEHMYALSRHKGDSLVALLKTNSFCTFIIHENKFSHVRHLLTIYSDETLIISVH
jgi:hypothetical protein